MWCSSRDSKWDRQGRAEVTNLSYSLSFGFGLWDGAEPLTDDGREAAALLTGRPTLASMGLRITPLAGLTVSAARCRLRVPASKDVLRFSVCLACGSAGGRLVRVLDVVAANLKLSSWPPSRYRWVRRPGGGGYSGTGERID